MSKNHIRISSLSSSDKAKRKAIPFKVGSIAKNNGVSKAIVLKFILSLYFVLRITLRKNN